MIPTLPADKEAAPNEVIESELDAFYFIDPEVMHQLPARHAFLVERDLGPQSAGSSWTTTLPQQVGLMSRSPSSIIATSNDIAPLQHLLLPQVPVQGQRQDVQRPDTHPGGLPAYVLTLGLNSLTGLKIRYVLLE